MTFVGKVCAFCKGILKGRVSTCGDIAKRLESGTRAVGQALRCNPYAPVVPCHRVVKANGLIGGVMGKVKGKKFEKKIIVSSFSAF